MKDLAELVELNRFVGREFLLWLWFESERTETNLRPLGGPACSLWLDTQITLSGADGEARIKAPMAAASKEAKTALAEGKLPTAARLHLIVEELEFSCGFRAEELAVSGLKVPSQLKADSEPDEALFERISLTERFMATMTALYAEFLALRLSPGWEKITTRELKKWARGKAIDEQAYEQERAEAVRRRASARKAAQRGG